MTMGVFLASSHSVPLGHFKTTSINERPSVASWSRQCFVVGGVEAWSRQRRLHHDALDLVYGRGCHQPCSFRCGTELANGPLECTTYPRRVASSGILRSGGDCHWNVYERSRPFERKRAAARVFRHLLHRGETIPAWVLAPLHTFVPASRGDLFFTQTSTSTFSSDRFTNSSDQHIC